MHPNKNKYLKAVFTLVFIIITFFSYSQEKSDTIYTTLRIPEETDHYFYKNRDYAFNLNRTEILKHDTCFKSKFLKNLPENPADTIWLNPYVKIRYDFAIKILCWNMIRSGNAFIINWKTNSIVDVVYDKSFVIIPTTYHQFIDPRNDSIIIQELTPWIGCPSF